MKQKLQQGLSRLSFMALLWGFFSIQVAQAQCPTNASQVKAPTMSAGGPTAFCSGNNVVLTAAIPSANDLSFAPTYLGSPGTDHWQSFVPTVLGATTAIQLYKIDSSSVSGTFTIYSGVGVSGPLVHTQTVSLGTLDAGWIVFTLPNLSLLPGNNYTFRWQGQNSTVLSVNQGNYGTYSRGGREETSSRLDFITKVVPTIGSYQWYNNSVAIGGANSAAYTATIAGDYTVAYKVCGFNSAASNSITVSTNGAGTASSTPTVCIDTPLTNITHTTTGATGIVTLNAASYSLPPAVVNPKTDSDLGNVTISLNGSDVLNNTTSKNLLAGTIGTAAGTSGSYADFTAYGPYAMYPGSTYTFSLRSIFTSSFPLQNGMAIYIDYNINGVFTDAGEQVYTSSALTLGAHTETGTFTIPTSALYGVTRMRVICNEGWITSPTQTVDFGEYEEYSISMGGIKTNYGLPAGVTAAWASNTITISGTPTTAGTFSYAIPLTGGCGSVNATGTITVTPPTMTASAASSTPTLCINTALTNITHTTTGATGIGTAIGLPTGVTAAWANNTITISGTPSAAGIFNYSIPLTMGCANVNATGTIRVTANMTAGAASSAPTLCINTLLPNITHNTAGATGIGTATGLPTGVTALWANNTISINGTPTAAGTFNYIIPLTGGCVTASATGMISVNPLPSAPTITGNLDLCSGSATTLSAGVVSSRQYASQVLGFSSAYGSNCSAWSPCQALGAPDVYPNYGDIEGSWANSNPNRILEYLDLSFSTPTPINYIDIYETFSPGSIYKVSIKNNATGLYEVIYNVTASPAPEISRKLHITFPLTSYNVSAVRIDMDTALFGNYVEIDAVAIGAENPNTYSWSNGATTPSITVTTGGDYAVTVTNANGCSATSIVTVDPGITIGAASSIPTLCLNIALTDITRTTTGATGIGTPTGLPSGVTASWATNTITISGSPTVSGVFNYSIPLLGACGSGSATGTIKVNQCYSITFDANGGTGTMANQAIAYNEDANLTANAFTRTGFVFGGWATTTTGAVAYANSEVYTMSASGNLTLYAKWIIRQVGGPMQIFVRQSESMPRYAGGMATTITLDVDSSASIEDLKQYLADFSTINVAPPTSFPIGNLKLLFAGIILQDGRTLADYNIQKESTLHLVAEHLYPDTSVAAGGMASVQSVAPSGADYANKTVSTTPNFTGTLSLLPSGEISVQNASPAGTYVIQISNNYLNYSYPFQSFNLTVSNPTGIISGNSTMCAGTSTQLSIALTGQGPWSGTLSDGTVFSGSNTPLLVTVSPTTTTTYTIATLSSGTATASATDLSGSAAVTVNQPTSYYADADGDGFGAGTAVLSCAGQPANTATNNTDCNPTDGTKWQLATFYVDADGDGFGNPAVSQQSCTGAPSGYVTNNTDCNDKNAAATTAIVISNQPVNATICAMIGGKASLSVGTAASTATYQWYAQAATATTWTLVANNTNYSGAATANLNIIKTSTTLPATGTKYKVVVTNPCGSVTSNIVSITDLTVLSKAATITVVGTLSPLLTACQGNSVNLSLAAGSVGNIQWQSSTDGISYSNVGTPIVQSALSATNLAIPFITGALTKTTWFRVVASNGVCATVNGTPIKITVSAPVTAGSITGGGVTVCAPLSSGLDANGNALTTAITNRTVLTLNGATVGATMVWQKSTNYVNTTNAAPVWVSAGSTTNSIIANALTADAWYRVQVTNGACVASSDPVKITVTKSAVAGVVTATTNGIVSASVCTGGDITFTSAAYVGSSIKWEVSTTSATTGFQAVAGADQLAFTMNAVSYVPLSTFYVRSVVTSGNCTIARSVVKTITVIPLSVAGTATGGGTICLGAKGTLALSGYTGTIQWESSTDGTNYVNVPIGLATAATTYASGSATGTASTYLADAIKGDTYFRAKVTSGPCAVVYSNVIKYTIAKVAASGTVTTANATLCSGTGTTLTLTGSIAAVKWFKSTNWTASTPSWTAVTTPTLTSLATGNLTASTAYKVETVTGACSNISTSNIVTVLVNSAPLAKAITANVTTPTGTSAALAICTGVAKTLTIGTGSVGAIQWQKSTTSTTVGFTDIANATSANYTVVNPTIGANYFRAKFTNSCGVSVYGTAIAVYYKDCPQTKTVTDLGTATFKVTGYPNPYTETFKLDITTQSNATVELMVYDMIGKLIEVRNSGVSELGTLEIGDRYATGVYNVIVTQGTEVKTLRMIKK